IPPQKEPIKVFFMDSRLHYLEFSDICRYVTVVLKNSTVDNITNLGLDNHIVYDNGDDMVDPLPSIQHGLFLNDD
ncbi:TPA: hypothetical protein VBC39_001398, partial [Streptococcus agalactiae]|nr:hypothetical protein [Streptococcus agalactiae]